MFTFFDSGSSHSSSASVPPPFTDIESIVIAAKSFTAIAFEGEKIKKAHGNVEPEAAALALYHLEDTAIRGEIIALLTQPKYLNYYAIMIAFYCSNNLTERELLVNKVMGAILEHYEIHQDPYYYCLVAFVKSSREQEEVDLLITQLFTAYNAEQITLKNMIVDFLIPVIDFLSPTQIKFFFPLLAKAKRDFRIEWQACNIIQKIQLLQIFSPTELLTNKLIPAIEERKPESLGLTQIDDLLNKLIDPRLNVITKETAVNQLLSLSGPHPQHIVQFSLHAVNTHPDQSNYFYSFFTTYYSQINREAQEAIANYFIEQLDRLPKDYYMEPIFTNLQRIFSQFNEQLIAEVFNRIRHVLRRESNMLQATRIIAHLYATFLNTTFLYPLRKDIIKKHIRQKTSLLPELAEIVASFRP